MADKPGVNSAKTELEPGQSAELTLLGKKTARLNGWIVSHRGGAIELTVPADVPAGTVLQVICGESMFLGEVRCCRPDGDTFTVGVEVEHALYNTSQLARLAARVLGEA